MVITKEIENTWCPSNKKYFEELGYFYTKMKDKFMAKFEDMPHSSDKFIEVQCDYCGKIFSKQIKKYYKSRKIIKKDCCQDCRKQKAHDARIEKYGYFNAYVNGYTVELHKEKCYDKKGKYIFQQIKDIFKEKDYILLSQEYINNHTPIKYICNKHSEFGEQSITWIHLKAGEGCYYCGLDKHRGENNVNWNGGSTELNHYLRHCIYPWIKDSLKAGDYKCDISKSKNQIQVHHLYKTFKDIVSETLELLNLDYQPDLSYYSEKELNDLKNVCLELHYKNGLGVCLTKEIHKEFHHIYGVKNTTKEQYYEFKRILLNKECA